MAIEAIKGQRTANEIAQEFVIHVSQVNEWKKHLMKGAAGIFNGGQERSEAQHDAERDQLYRQIGKLQVEVDWLKKKGLMPMGR